MLNYYLLKYIILLLHVIFSKIIFVDLLKNILLLKNKFKNKNENIFYHFFEYAKSSNFIHQKYFLF